MESIVPVGECCPFCRAKLILDAESNELVCRCGYSCVVPVFSNGFAGEDHEIVSVAVLGNGLGQNHSTRNSDGSSFSYSARGNNGEFGDKSAERRIAKRRPDNIPEDHWGVLKTTILTDVREFNFANMEEPDPQIANLKISLVKTLTSGPKGLRDERVSIVASPIIKEKIKRQKARENLENVPLSYLYDRIGDPVGSATKKLCPLCYSNKFVQWQSEIQQYTCGNKVHEKVMYFEPSEMIVRVGKAATPYGQRFIEAEIEARLDDPLELNLVTA